MTFNLQVRRLAEVDIAEATVWYEKKQTGLGTQFQSEVSRAFKTLQETPLIYPLMYRDVRRVLLHRFPYLIWYRVVDDQVNVLACSHARQRSRLA